MTLYYTDIETTGLDPREAHITSLQTVERKPWGWGPLTIIQSRHDEGEERKLLLSLIDNGWFSTSPWTYQPVGWCLHFERAFILGRAQYHSLIPDPLPQDKLIKYMSKPGIDGQQLAIMANNLQLKGTKMSQWTQKEGGGGDAKLAAEEGRWSDLDAYTQQETMAFLQWFNEVIEALPSLLKNLKQEVRIA